MPQYRAASRSKSPSTASTADLFCGGGGSTSAIVGAFSEHGIAARHIAVNHAETAVQTLRLNFPDVHVVRGRLEDIENPRALVNGGRLDLLSASPACTNHSKAKAGRPRDEQSRSTADLVTHWAKATQAKRLFIENVAEFRLWGPLDDDGKPLKNLHGLYYDAWFTGLKMIYPNLEARVVNAAGYGDATFRRRLVIMGSLDGEPLLWPEETHGAAGSGLAQYRTTADIVQWDMECGTVGAKRRAGYFNRISRMRGANERLLCIEAGLDIFGGDPFVIRRNQHNNTPESNVKTVHEPLHTITTKSTDIALITPRGRNIDRALHRMLTPFELKRAMSFPDDYMFMGTPAEQVKMIGNAVPRRMAQAHLSALLHHSGEMSRAAA